MNTICDFYSKFNKDISWINNKTIYLVLHGSRAYNTHTETSDYDFKGVCIPPKEYYIGGKRFEQAELHDPDTVVYEFRKFINLASACNPNIIEVLFVDPEDIIYIDSIGEELRNNRELFLSKRIKYTFSGYAVSQLKRIRLHRRWLMNPPSKPPTRKDLKLPEQTLIPKDQLVAAEAAVQKEMDKFNFDFMEGLDESTKIGIKNTMSEMIAGLQITSEDQWMASARKIGLSDNLIEVMQKEREYTSKKREWDQYQNWKKTRNPKRAALEEKFGYDCYSADDTEFLTEKGWRKFDDISENDKLATVFVGEPTTQKKKFELEYQRYIDKFDGTFTGEMYRLYGYHTDVLVTPNHRMLVQELEKNNHKTKSNWKLEEISRLSNCFQCLRNITPNIKNYKENFPETEIPKEAYLRLMGWYLSDGYANKKRTIKISQKKNGKLYSSMKKFANKYDNAALYEYERDPNEFNSEKITEAILSICTNDSEKIINDCGKTKNKRIPRWIYSLSQRKMNILLDAMMMGDGTKSRPDHSMIYYSSSEKLANDMQELAFMCGYETSLYGPYEKSKNEYKTNMYYIHINKTRKQFKVFHRSTNVEKIPCVNKRIVCFTVPNGTLITRRNGHVAIHGNSKHAYHLVRLIRMCGETLTTGKVIVKRPDRDELLAIRNGAWTYDQLIEFAENEEKRLNDLYKTCNVLPKTANKHKLDQLCMRLVERSLSKYSWYNIKKVLNSNILKGL